MTEIGLLESYKSKTQVNFAQRKTDQCWGALLNVTVSTSYRSSEFAAPEQYIEPF
jgi:hypothetical protein